MRIRTDGDKEHRLETIEEAADELECNKTRAVVTACDLVGTALPALEAALADADIRPSEKRKLVEALDSRHFSAEYTDGDVSLGAE